MYARSLLKTIAILSLITAIVCLSLKYILPLVFPFILAYIFMRMLLPAIKFLNKKCGLPSWFSYSSILAGFFISASGAFMLIIWLLCRQVQLLVNNFPVYYQLYSSFFYNSLKKCCNCIDYYLSVQNGTTLNFANEKIADLQTCYIDKLVNNAGQIFSGCFSVFARVMTLILIIVISMIVLCRDIDKIHNVYAKSRFYPQIHKIMHTLKETGLGYIKSQGIIICVNWFVCSIAFLLIHNPYFILIGLLISLVDALPILGSGMVLCPVGIYYIFHNNFAFAAILFTAYIITVFVREILEARLLGGNMDILPFFMLLSIYIGLKIFGITGIVLGPFGVVIIRTIYETFASTE
ncbi:MAG: AI-2E family transporter [Lachnospiraceae bacterium]|nr:AI-2E family transporter [Lachnospiraceae bacterium]